MLCQSGDASFTVAHQTFTFLKSYGTNQVGESTDFGTLRVPVEQLFDIKLYVDTIVSDKFSDVSTLEKPCLLSRRS
jgi:hypothetical protein